MWKERYSQVSSVCMCTEKPEKPWKLSVNSIRICPINFRIIKRWWLSYHCCHLWLPNLSAWVSIVCGSYFFSFLCLLFFDILSTYYSMLTSYMNVATSWNLVEIAADAQASLLPHGLGQSLMKLGSFLTKYVTVTHACHCNNILVVLNTHDKFQE